MTHRLQRSTRAVATATAGGTLLAAVDTLDRQGATDVALAIAGVLLLAGFLVTRLHRVAIEVGTEEVVVRNVLSTRRVPAEEVAEIRPGRWRSRVVLTDGREIPTLLRDRDLAEVATDVRATPAATG